MYAIRSYYVIMGFWTLIPDKFDESEAKLAHYGVFMTTLIAFFFAEMGDKTHRITSYNVCYTKLLR